MALTWFMLLPFILPLRLLWLQPLSLPPPYCICLISRECSLWSTILVVSPGKNTSEIKIFFCQLFPPVVSSQEPWFNRLSYLLGEIKKYIFCWIKTEYFSNNFLGSTHHIASINRNKSDFSSHTVTITFGSPNSNMEYGLIWFSIQNGSVWYNMIEVNALFWV